MADIDAIFAYIAASDRDVAERLTFEIGETRKSITGVRKILVSNDDGVFQTAPPAGEHLAILSQDGETLSETPLRVAAGERAELTLK